MDSQSPPKGSLEELFRHHLLESEAAAVPPRPLVWEHIDNGLLLAENEKYRRRLLVHRWGMAASLLLAALAGGGWWHSQLPATPNLARATAAGSAAQVAVATTTYSTQSALNRAGGRSQATLAAAIATSQAARTSTSRAPQAPEANQQLVAAGSHSRAARVAPGQAAALGAPAAPTLATYAYRTAMASRRGPGPTEALASTSSFTTTQPIGSTATTSPLTEFSTTATSLGQVACPASGQYTAAGATAPVAALAANQLGEGLLAGTQAQLALGAPDELPASLTPLDAAQAPATKLRRWRFGATYAVTAFNPNVDFASSNGNYYPSASFAAPASALNYAGNSRSAAAEYRANLRAGLGQRLSLRATRWLGGHWSLSTGLEATQQEATSATTVGFDGVHLDVANAYNLAPRPLQASSYRYRSAGVPLELRYDNPIKTGVSFYGRLGAIVSALLNVRTEVAGNPETARSYSPFAGSTPYRRLTTILRGGAGVRYRPANKGWGVSVGPTAETGVQSLNSDTDKNFLQQSRPYSFGLEAGFEFGGGAVPVQ